ncbi:hypothetical protein G8C15_17345 [Enterococcus casseliflavus]|nr:hypothetical protein [Enterococcus casseliflavus]MBF0015424.1 hypothetical protein [Enterococcus casseliflavus]
MFDSQEDPEVGALKNFGKTSLSVIGRLAEKVSSYMYSKVMNSKKIESSERIKAPSKIEQSVQKNGEKKTVGIEKDNSKNEMVERKESFEQKKQEASAIAKIKNTELSSLVKERSRISDIPSLSK